MCKRGQATGAHPNYDSETAYRGHFLYSVTFHKAPTLRSEVECTQCHRDAHVCQDFYQQASECNNKNQMYPGQWWECLYGPVQTYAEISGLA